jgi:hypothetical protein
MSLAKDLRRLEHTLLENMKGKVEGRRSLQDNTSFGARL